MGQNRPRTLALSRETIRDLTSDQLSLVEGAKSAAPDCVPTTYPTLRPCPPCREC